MRVTENTNFNLVQRSIGLARGRMEKLQAQTATLKKLNTPSDNPISAAKIMELRTEKANNDQFNMNIKMAQSFLSNADSALSELSEVAVRAKEIALGQASGASSNDDTRIGVAEEVSQLFLQAVSAGNRKIGNRYIFGGYKTDHPPVNPLGEYKGDNGDMMVEVAKDVFVSINIPGNEVFNAMVTIPVEENGRVPAGEIKKVEPQTAGINLYKELQNFRIALLTGDLRGIRETLENFDALGSHLIALRAKAGSRVQGLDGALGAMERHNLVNAQLSSELEDADMAQVMSDLAKEETVLRSALQSGQKLIQPTLMDFLR